jgi:hypothetical protein
MRGKCGDSIPKATAITSRSAFPERATSNTMSSWASCKSGRQKNRRSTRIDRPAIANAPPENCPVRGEPPPHRTYRNRPTNPVTALLRQAQQPSQSWPFASRVKGLSDHGIFIPCDICPAGITEIETAIDLDRGFRTSKIACHKTAHIFR